MAVSSGHLERGVAEDATESVQVATFLDEPAREGVSEIVVAEVGQPGSGAGRDEPLLGITDLAAIGLAEQERRRGTAAITKLVI